MPNLAQSLSKYDIGFLQIIAHFWDLELQGDEKREAAQELTQLMLQTKAIHDLMEELPEEAINALKELLSHKGQIPYALLSRKYGEIRQVGIAKRDREMLYLSPVSTLEFLWYRGLIYRDFLERDGSIEEMVYIPSDLLQLLPLTPESPAVQFTGFALPGDYAHQYTSNDCILEDACTFLAWLRKNPSQSITQIEPFIILGSQSTALQPAGLFIQFLFQLLISSNLIQADNSPIVDNIKDFLSEPNDSAINRLLLSWLSSTHINELKSLPEIICSGDWNNEPIATRQFLLQQIQSINHHQWINLESFINHIKHTNPDFQRPSGNYDVWIINERISGNILRGFESWDAVEGRLLNYLITGPLFWLGLVALGTDEKNNSIRAFKPTVWFEDIVRGNKPTGGFQKENPKMILQSNGKITVPIGFPRQVRYHIARSCDWESFDIQNRHFIYRITAESLSEARKQGLKPQQLVAIFRKYTTNFPPNLFKAIVRWEEQGSEIQLKYLTVLNVSSPEIVSEIKKSRLAKHILQTINPTTIAIHPGSEDIMVKGLLELGYLVDLPKS